MNDLIGDGFASILVAGFLVGVIVGLTGMGGGALMTPARFTVMLCGYANVGSGSPVVSRASA